MTAEQVCTGQVLADGRRVTSASTGTPHLMSRTTFLRLDDGRTLMLDPTEKVELR